MKEQILSRLLLVALALATNDVLAAAPETAAAKLGGTATRTGKRASVQASVLTIDTSGAVQVLTLVFVGSRGHLAWLL